MQVSAVPTHPNSPLPTVVIATWTGPQPTGSTDLFLEVDERVDLAPYVAAGMSLKIDTKGFVPYDDVSMKGDIGFKVNPL